MPVDDDDGALLRFVPVPSSLTNEVKEIFVESSSTLEQARRVQEKFVSLADDIGQEANYLSRLNQFPRLMLTNILFMLQSHCHLGNMDCNMESLKNLFPSSLCSHHREIATGSINFTTRLQTMNWRKYYINLRRGDPPSPRRSSSKAVRRRWMTSLPCWQT